MFKHLYLNIDFSEALHKICLKRYAEILIISGWPALWGPYLLYQRRPKEYVSKSLKLNRV